MSRPARARTAPVSATLLATVVALLLGVLTLGVTSVPAQATGTESVGAGRSDPFTGAERRTARTALSRAESAVAGTADGGRPDLTLAMRDLALSRAALDGPGQRRASRLLARPSSPSRAETPDLVVHAPSGVSDAYVATVLATATRVHDTYLGAGYREPLPDGTAGGDGRLDIYVTDLGSTGAYGYCASDQPTSVPGRDDKWAFCVVDDDYKGYPGYPDRALPILQVTLAHEYFHAVQYAYDAAEDGWFMEGTAVWAEDELFDDVDDNRQYAPYSPLARPTGSLDVFEPDGFSQYGSWLFFRWLSERFPAEQGGLPTIVRDLWEAADSTVGDADRRYSLMALSTVLKARGLPLPRAFALFADANRRPEQVYSEAVANDYPTAPLRAKVRLGGRGAAARTFSLDHLASATARFVPRRVGDGRRLRLRIDMADKAAGSVAVVSTYRRDGSVRTRLVSLDARGDGGARVPFASDRVRGVEVTLANASTRMRDCFRSGVTWSCFGTPVDQGVAERVRAAVVR